MPLPGVLQLIPIFELTGAKTLNNGLANQDNLIADAGFRINLRPIGTIQPRLGIAVIFPVDETARQDTHWGIVTSLVFEY